MSDLFKFLLLQQQERMMAKLSEVSGLLTQISTQLDKAKTEILTKISDLETQLADISLPPEVDAALDALKTSAQALDDVVPDQP